MTAEECRALIGRDVAIGSNPPERRRLDGVVCVAQLDARLGSAGFHIAGIRPHTGWSIVDESNTHAVRTTRTHVATSKPTLYVSTFLVRGVWTDAHAAESKKWYADRDAAYERYQAGGRAAFAAWTERTFGGAK